MRNEEFKQKVEQFTSEMAETDVCIVISHNGGKNGVSFINGSRNVNINYLFGSLMQTALSSDEGRKFVEMLASLSGEALIQAEEYEDNQNKRRQLLN